MLNRRDRGLAFERNHEMARVESFAFAVGFILTGVLTLVTLPLA
jgi:hypothetical protein